ncbi:LysR family transcriptional regulator [Desulfoluna spongiiphila]|uniref:LysR family transcriptional regulator n=1 Tax=Desulfoluna spongiiphila TaxID=419481 RepID=UPI00125A6676|nr:LysR family transcriptional regulator [Desulfoluna spongiiphila]VVS95134.1 transcription regulator hth lysr [Desulfoluna spongiiphila]
MSVDSLSPSHLKALGLLLEEGHVTKAAARMRVSQSAMSKILGKLREAFSDDLLVRVGNRLELTERAQAIRPRLEVILGELAAMASEAPFDPAGCRRWFTLAVSDYVAQFVLPDLLCSIHAEAPGIRVSLVTERSDTVVEELVENRIQVASAIEGEGPLPPGVVCRWVGTDSFACVGAKGHPLARNCDMEGYLKAPHVVVTGGSDKAGPIDRALSALGRQRTVALETSLFASAMEVVAQSDFILTIPAHIARHLARRYDADVFPLPFEVPPFRYGLLWHERHRRDAAHAWLRRKLVEQLQDSDYSH